MDTHNEDIVNSVTSASQPSQNTYPSLCSSVSTVDHEMEQTEATMLHDPFEQTETQVVSRTFEPEQHHPAGMVLGEFSFAPTTETTVYTTKVVKTINFPPLVMKGPKHLHDLDPKMYPLAASPTPSALKKFCFDVDGKPTVFREAQNPEAALQEIREQNRQLEASGGRLGSRKGYGQELETPQRKVIRLRGLSHGADKRPSGKAPIYAGRETPGPRRHEVHHPSATSTRVTRRTASSSQTDSSQSNKSSSRLRTVQTSTPITPSAELKQGAEVQGDARLEQSRGMSPPPLTITPNTQGRDFVQTLSPQPEINMERSFSTDDNLSTGTLEDMVEGASATTPPTDRLSQASFQLGSEPQYRPRPSALDTTAAQDASLPSPSLSPVTAAANLQSRRGYFDDIASISRRSTGESQALQPGGLALYGDVTAGPQIKSVTEVPHHPSNASLMDIPRLLDTFEAMPMDMQRYVMFQLLRRCPKPVLHSVADTVVPALKCDFLALLPAELGHNIISHLDLRSLCRASQTSKKWRQIIDSDEKIWKNLLIAEGFSLPQEELSRAILEGWGWQPWSTLEDAEPDLGGFAETTSDNHPSPATSATTVDTIAALAPVSDPSQPPSSRRSKRKVATKGRAPSRKMSKRAQVPADDAPLYDISALTRHIKSAEGPYAAAKAAITAVPSSKVGIEDLRSMTLHKNIYRRHHLISEAWMQEEVKPHHLAFKAHGRHVVTCLQFDSDKILTGSDDTNINVYDTRTGALRAKLTGHEGGVWALRYVDNILVSGSTDRSVRIWNIEKGECTHVFHGHTSTVRCLIILEPTEIGKDSRGRPIMMPKERTIITGSRDSTLRVWRLPKEGETSPTLSAADESESPYFQRALTGHIHSVRAIAAHGDTLISGSYDCTVRVWKISTGETLHRLTGHGQKVYSVVLDHENKRCISGSMDNFVKIWSLETGACLFTLDGHSSLVGLLDLQRSRLVSAAADSTLRIWDLEKGQCRHTLSAHTGAITCFQHDGKKVISGSDRNLKMWNIETGMFVRDLLTDLSGVWQVNFDERRCVAAVQRNSLTYIEILDFGASRDGVPECQRGRRIVVDTFGTELNENNDEAEAAEN